MKNTCFKSFLLAMFCLIAMVSLAFAMEINIDGDKSDWAHLLRTDPLDTSPAEADITIYASTRDDEYIYLAMAVDSSGNSGSYMTFTLDGTTVDYFIQVNIRNQGQKQCTIPTVLITDLSNNASLPTADVLGASGMVSKTNMWDTDNDCFAELKVPASLFPPRFVYSKVLFSTQPSSSDQSAVKEIVVPLSPTAISLATIQDKQVSLVQQLAVYTILLLLVVNAIYFLLLRNRFKNITK